VGRKNIRSVGSSGCLLLVLVAIVVIIILGYNNQSFSQALNLKHSWSGGVKDAIILLKPINIKEEGDKIKADVILSNLTLTWVFTNQVYLPSATAKVPVGGPVYSYLLGPNQSKVLGTVEFQKGSYLQLNAKSPVGIDYQRFGYEDAALLGAVALDLIMRGFFKKELPSNAFDEPLLIGVETGIGSIPHLFYNITSHCSGPLGAFGYAIGRKDISGALEALGKFVICTSKGPIKEKVKDFLKALFSVEVADKWMEKFSTNLVDFLNLPERASLLYIISKYTFSAPPQGWGRIEALEAGVISKLPKTIIDVYNRLGGLSTFEEPILQDYTTPSGLASTGTPYKGVEFSRGGIYESSIGVFAVYGAIYQKYKVIGGPRHYLGLPISNEEGVPKSTFGTTGRISRFERGSIVWLKEKNQTFIVQGGIFDKWASLGYSGGQLGFPTSDEYPYQGGARSDFEGGYITWTSKTGAQVVLKGSPLPISARINNYSASPTKIQVGQTTTFKVAFTNTGNTQWTFGAGISLRRPDGVRIDNLPTQPVKLNPNQQGIATWTYTIDREGSWEVVFGIWKDPAGKDLLTQTGWIKGLVITEAIPSKPTVGNVYRHIALFR